MTKKTIQQAAENKPQKNGKNIRDYVDDMMGRGQIAKALPSVITPERFTRIVLTALSTTPQLNDCTPQSFLGAMMTAAQLGVEPNTALGQAYLIPFQNRKKGVTECQFQLGYKGLIDLAYRSGQVETIQAQTVYENDTFEYEYGLDPKLRHKPAKTDRGNPIYFYAILRMKDGGYSFEVISVEDARKHGKMFSKSFSTGPWKTNFEEMAKKTVLKRVLKYAPLKSDFVRAVVQDETIKSEISDDMSLVENEFDFAAIDEDVIDVEPAAETADLTTGELLSEEAEK